MSALLTNTKVANASDADLNEALQMVQAETARRDAIIRATASLEQAIRVLNPSREDGADWVQPTDATNAYPSGARVSHKGKTWEATVLSVWEPGVSGWREVAAGTDPADWVQPTGAHDAYHQGDRVRHDMRTWVSNLDGNVWIPGVYGWTVE